VRGAMEAAQGRRTFHGHGLVPGFRADRKGYAVAAGLLAAKWIALMAMHPDWRVRAAFVFPILGLCARAFAFLLDARRGRRTTRARAARPGYGPLAGKAVTSKMLAGRRVRAGFLSGALLFLAFLFPPGVALALLACSAAAAWLTLRLRREARGSGGEHAGRLTLQTAALTSEVAEVGALAVVAVAALAR
jgi:hypothetical protein